MSATSSSTLPTKFRFTNSSIKSLPAQRRDAAATELEFSDTEVIGLKLLSGKSQGSKRFLLRYTLQGKKRSIALGRFGVSMSVKPEPGCLRPFGRLWPSTRSALARRDVPLRREFWPLQRSHRLSVLIEPFMFSYLGSPERGKVGVGYWLSLVVKADRAYATICRVAALFVAHVGITSQVVSLRCCTHLSLTVGRG